MHIGVISSSYLNNYGSVLQAYALQTYLTNAGHNVEIIQYIPHPLGNSILEKVFNLYRKTGFIQATKELSQYIVSSILTKHISHQNNIFSDFRSSYLFISPERYLHPEELRTFPPDYDVYIAGSDNIWGSFNNTGVTELNYPYYLDFVPIGKHKISYAASMGTPKLNEQQIPSFVTLLANFDYISVRGNSTAEYVRSLCCNNIANVLDPTLLLTGDEWCNKFPAINKSEIISKKYVLVYVIYPLSKSAPIYQFVKKFAKRNNLIIKYVGYFHPKFGFPSYSDETIQDFLTYFKFASIIVTDSFHGTLFSLIFQKNFYTFPPRASENRITDMLSSINLLQRFVHTVSDAEVLNVEIDYTIPEQKLNELREFSMTWLNNAINSDKTSEAAS